MRNLLKGDKVRYVGKGGTFFTRGFIYEVLREVDFDYQIDGEENFIVLKDNWGDEHYITESYFIDNFKIFMRG